MSQQGAQLNDSYMMMILTHYASIMIGIVPYLIYPSLRMKHEDSRLCLHLY